MSETVRVSLPDGSAREFPAGTTVLEVAEAIGPRLARDTVAGMVNGDLVDLRTALTADADLRIVTAKDPEAGDVIRHSAEHVLADAVKRLWPGTPIDAGRQDHSEKYQYDFRFPRAFKPEDFEKIEAEMARIITEDLEFDRQEADRAEVREVMTEDERNEMLQRIYGTAFASKKELNAYFARLEELKRRDHRRLGRELDLFSFHPEAPASPFFHPRGALVYNALIDLMREKYAEYGYEEVITPQIFDVELWKRSGHYENYRDDMFFADEFDEVEERSMSVKPMNCPSHCLLFGGKAHSYRDLPRRIADFGRLHRYERSGVVTGLTRVRTFSQDDAHIFCTPEQIETEITALFDFIFEIYRLFGFEDIKFYLSTRPENAMGDPEVWRHAEEVLQRCLESREDLEFTIKPGDGAFYGPKIDFDVHDALGRAWQLATIQLDFQMPERFELTYVDSDGSEKRPVMIHRAILGSLERFYGVMLEHFGGDLPPWIAPEQARVLPITDAVNDYAEKVAAELTKRGLRADVDRRSEKLGYKIRDGETTKVPYLLVVGQREADDGTVSLRLRHRRDEGVLPLDEVVDRIVNAVETRSLKL
ncbi:MAG: threonine--tRNA ligase [Acidobacteria bacterium]|nr:threonine--tRNA ligase [Candidatus Sulfomarinibacter kjeldsenii]